MLSHKLDPGVRLFLEKIAEEDGAALETLPPAEARKSAAEWLETHAGEPERVALIGRASCRERV